MVYVFMNESYFDKKKKNQSTYKIDWKHLIELHGTSFIHLHIILCKLFKVLDFTRYCIYLYCKYIQDGVSNVENG
jgi:hypothetical protein